MFLESRNDVAIGADQAKVVEFRVLGYEGVRDVAFLRGGDAKIQVAHRHGDVRFIVLDDGRHGPAKVFPQRLARTVSSPNVFDVPERFGEVAFGHATTGMR